VHVRYPQKVLPRWRRWMRDPQIHGWFGAWKRGSSRW
jgi:hypothetical protein